MIGRKGRNSNALLSMGMGNYQQDANAFNRELFPYGLDDTLNARENEMQLRAVDNIFRKIQQQREHELLLKKLGIGQ